MKIYSKRTLQLFIQSPTEHVATINGLDVDTFIFELKSKVELHTGILAEAQNIFMNEVRLEDGKTLDELNIKSGSFARVKLKEHGLQQIYINAVNGNTKDIFMLGVQLIQHDEFSEHLGYELDQTNAWNLFVPVRAFQALFAASFSGQLNLITELLKKSATNINMVTKNGRSVLHAASSQGHLMCVNLLLAQGVDVKLVDKQGMTALMLAAENGHVRVEKRIWLFTWNLDVLDEIESTKEEKKCDDEEVMVDLKREAKRYYNLYDDSVYNGGCTKLPVIEGKTESYSKIQIEKVKPTKFPKVISSEERVSLRKKKLRPELKITNKEYDLKNGSALKEEKILIREMIPEAVEKNTRVSAWVQSTAIKGPLKGVSYLPVCKKVLDSKNVCLQLEDRNWPNIVSPSHTKQVRNESEIATRENDQKDEKDQQNTSMAANKTMKEPKCATVFLPLKFGNEEDIGQQWCTKKEIIKTDPCLITKSIKKVESKEDYDCMEKSEQGDGIDKEQIGSKCSSCNRYIPVLEFPTNYAEDIAEPTEFWISSDDNIVINVTDKEGNIEEDTHTVIEKYEFWRPESSLFSSSDLYRRYRKTYDEWLEEKKELKRETRKESLFSINGDSVGQVEKAEKNEVAFKEWLAMKSRGRSKTKAESTTDKVNEKDKPKVQEGLAFEKWLKTKQDNPQRPIEELSVRRRSERIRQGMSFEQWKNYKDEQRKHSKSSSGGNDVDKNKKTTGGIPFQEWLQIKNEDNKYNLILESTLKAQEERRLSFLLQFRFNDPRQRTFEEWYLEKECELARERSQRKLASIERHKNKIRYPEDSNLIFDMWLSNKFAIDIKHEKEKLLEVKRRENEKPLEIIREWDDNMSTVSDA